MRLLSFCVGAPSPGSLAELVNHPLPQGEREMLRRSGEQYAPRSNAEAQRFPSPLAGIGLVTTF
jgi:hypothetical protein